MGRTGHSSETAVRLSTKPSLSRGSGARMASHRAYCSDVGGLMVLQSAVNGRLILLTLKFRTL